MQFAAPKDWKGHKQEEEPLLFYTLLCIYCKEVEKNSLVHCKGCAMPYMCVLNPGTNVRVLIYWKGIGRGTHLLHQPLDPNILPYKLFACHL